MQRVSERRAPASIAVAALLSVLAVAMAVGAGIGSTNIVGATLFLSVALWFVLSWRIGVAALIVISCVDGFVKLVHASTATFLLKDVTLALLLIGMVAALAVRPELRPRGAWRGLWLWGCFFAFLALEAVSPTTSLSHGLAGFRAHALFALLFVVGAVYFNAPQRLTKMADLIVGAITFAALIGIVQYLMGDAWLSIAGGLAVASRHYVTFSPLAALLPGQTGLVYRAYGTLVDPEALGLACSLGLLYAAAALARARGLKTLWLAGAIAIMMSGLVLAGARSAMLGAAVGMAALLIFAFTQASLRRIAWLALVVCALALPLGVKLGNGTLQERLTGDATTYAAQTRDRSASLVLAAVARKPLGMGLGATGAGGKYRGESDSNRLAVDNLYLAYLYELGPLGLGMLVALQLGFFVLTYRALRSAASIETRATYAGMAAAQVALLAAGFMTQGAFDYAPVAQAFWLMSGAIALPARVEGQA